MSRESGQLNHILTWKDQPAKARSEILSWSLSNTPLSNTAQRPMLDAQRRTIQHPEAAAFLSFFHMLNL